MLVAIRDEFGLPVLSDVHYPEQAASAGAALDVVQIPAYLCMQTDLLEAAARTGKPVNVERGQFIALDIMASAIGKLEASSNRKILLTERGYAFGYNDLVVDPRSFPLMRSTGYPVVFDITHSIRRYGIPSADPRGATRELMPVLARAAVGAGIDGLFLECHPDPPTARCDAASP